MDDEILIKVAADLSELKPQFQDMSVLWEQHNKDVDKGEKAYKKYADTVGKENDKVNKKLKQNIDQISSEGKAIESLEKKFTTLNNKNKESFDSKKLETFNENLKKVSQSMSSIESLDLNIDDIDKLMSKLSGVEGDFETLNVLVDFFEEKMKSSASSVVDSFETIQKKIEETKLNIGSTEAFIKSIDADIKTTAPGQVQANLIQERDAAKRALEEEKIALVDYQNQLKKAREENVAMTTQLRKVKDELIQLELAGERGGERWIELSQKAQVYNEAIRDTNAELNRATKSTAGLDNLIGAATGIVGLFSAAEGAAALFGNESEDLQKTLVKLNGAIALLNGLQAIQTELSKKETVAGRALTLVKAQYAVATDASAKATTRLAAATKLLGIGLLVGALAAIVVYWKDISMWLGIVNEKQDALNKINKTAASAASGEIGRLKGLQIELTNVNTPLDRQREIRKDLLEQYPTYLKVLGDEKASLDEITAAFDNLNKALLLNAQLKAAADTISERFKTVIEDREIVKKYETDDPRYSPEFNDALREVSKKNLDKSEKDFNDYADFIGNIIAEINIEIAKLGGDPTKDGDRLKALQKEYEKYASILEALVKRQESLRIDLIENSRQREIELLQSQIEEEKKAYKKQIDELKLSEDAKLKLRQEYNKLYNTETGLAYEKLRKLILEIDKKYDEELEKVRLNSLMAIAQVYDTTSILERDALAKKWDDIREELRKQIKLTNDESKKAELQGIIDFSFVAQGQEETDFDTQTNLDAVEIQKEIADAILLIYQNNAKKILKNEKLKQLQLLNLEKDYLKQVIDAYRRELEGEQLSLFDSLVDTLQNSTDINEITAAAEQLRESFGDKTANEILKTVAALKEVGNEIEKISLKTNFQDIIDDIAAWTSSLESFSKKLADTLGLQGDAANEFASGVATAIQTTWDSLQSIFQAEIDQHREKINTFQEGIDTVEEELEREKELREQGYANNYELKQKELETLKEQKAKEEEELKKAQKRKAALAKAELLIDTVSQLTNMITAATNIFKWASAIPFVGVPLAIGLIAAMFGAFAVAKANAFQAIGQGQNFRQGLKEGRLSLDGPSHEERGFGLYNSKTGERVAEFEGGEDVLVVNRRQKNKYKHILDALIADAKGLKPIHKSMSDKYGVKNVGETTLKVVQRVNKITVEATESKENASKNEESFVDELRDFKDTFKTEFEGYKKERDNETESWETPKFYYVKKGKVVKKYRKDED